jgi:hypothetical protein
MPAKVPTPVCINCGELYTRAVPCFDHCEYCIPRNEAAKIKTLADLCEYQRSCGADV